MILLKSCATSGQQACLWPFCAATTCQACFWPGPIAMWLSIMSTLVPSHQLSNISHHTIADCKSCSVSCHCPLSMQYYCGANQRAFLANILPAMDTSALPHCCMSNMHRAQISYSQYIHIAEYSFNIFTFYLAASGDQVIDVVFCMSIPSTHELPSVNPIYLLLPMYPICAICRAHNH